MAAHPQPTPIPDERRKKLLAAATQVFARYGFRKASMDEVARAAEMSRQGVYLHFPTKEALFHDVVELLLDSSLGAGMAALSDSDRPIEERLLAAFDAAHGQFLGAFTSSHMNELLDASTRLLGPVVQEREQAFREALALALRRAGRVPSLPGVTGRAVAETLEAASLGIKHRVDTRDEYLARMRTAIRVCCGRGVPASR